MSRYYGRPLSVTVKDGELRISIGVHVLAHAASYSDWANPFDEERDDYIRTFAITDAVEFAKDVQHAMLAEAEDGSSPLSHFLDKAMSDAVDDGSLTVECDQIIKHGETAPSETWAVRRGRTEEQDGAGTAMSRIETVEHTLDVTVVYTFDTDRAHYVDFLAVEIISEDVTENGVYRGRGYNRKGAESTPDFVFDPQDAEPYVRGSVKWDGCANYEVGDQEQVMMHACSRSDLETLSRVLVTIYERCGELMKAHGCHVLDGVFQCEPTRRAT